MIITSSEIKSFLGITSTVYDAQISALINPVLYDVFDYTNNHFHNNNVRLISHNFTFSTGGSITVSGTNFSTWSFQSGDEIHIVNSARNDGFYTASSVSSTAITISTTQTIKSEDSETFCTIVKMDIPESLKPIISGMVKWKIDNPYGKMKSESLGDYSYTMGGISDYPDSIVAALNKYRLVKFA